MRVHFKGVWFGILVLIFGIAEQGLSETEPSRVVLVGDPHCSWVRRDKPWVCEPGRLRVRASGQKDVEFAFEFVNGAKADFSYCAAEKLKLSFRIRNTARASVVVDYTTLEAPNGMPGKWQEFALPTSAEFREFAIDVIAPAKDCEIASLRLKVVKGEGEIELTDVRLDEIKPERTSGTPLLLNGNRARAIWLKTSSDPVRALHEIRAARLFRFALYRTGGEYLPIRTVRLISEAEASGVLVGDLAVDAGIVGKQDAMRMADWSGGCVSVVKGGRLGVYGAELAGAQLGLWRVLSRLGIEYLSADRFKVPESSPRSLADFTDVCLPKTVLRTTSERCGINSELRGLIHWGHVFGNHAVGANPETSVLSGDSLGYIVGVEEFSETHPEFFAQQADGKRLGRGTAPGLTQFCWSCEGLVRIVAERYVEIMRKCPEQKLFWLAPGDGGNRYCKCDRCKALGSTSDGMVSFGNRVAAETAKAFPDNRLYMYSYVDTPYPPTKVERMHPNLKMGYCIYPEATWPSAMIWDHPANARGFEALDGWRKLVPDIGCEAYYQQCGEWMTHWPGYDCDFKMARDFASQPVPSFITYRFGMTPRHRNGGISQCSSFCDLLCYVMPRIEVNPNEDPIALSHAYISAQYGVAAVPMQAYFDLSFAEPKRRDWVQRCEQHLNGFITPGYAAKALGHLDAAEAAAGADPILRPLVIQEKINFLWRYFGDVSRGNGTLPKDEFKAWAARLGEFCRLCRESGTYYMGAIKPADWFWENAIYEIGTKGVGNWLNDPAIEKLVEDPEKALGAEFPNLQRRVSGGYEIPPEGMLGGLDTRDCLWRRTEKANVRILRRPSSGYGTVYTRLDLEEAQKRSMKLVMPGIDSEKPAVAEMEIQVNGTSIYRGKVPYLKDRWSEQSFEIPQGLLKAGENEIKIMNVTGDAEKDAECGDRFAIARNYFWGWFIIEKVKVVE